MRLPEARLEAPMPTVCSGVRPVGEANTGLTGPDMGAWPVSSENITQGHNSQLFDASFTKNTFDILDVNKCRQRFY